MIESIIIPKENLKNLERIKKKIEEKTDTHITITPEGEVTIEGESIQAYNAQKVVKAVARGFKPHEALLLTGDDTTLEIIEIKDFAGKSKNDMIRLRGRVIGEKGKAKRNVEKLTNTKISVFGKTIGIMGRMENVLDAREVINSLLSGSKHGTAYKIIKRKQMLKKVRF